MKVLTNDYQELKDISLIDYKTLKVRDIPEFLGDEKPWADYSGLKPTDSTAERHLYYRIAKDLGPGNYADIGVWRGSSAACLANGLFYGGHKGTIYAVDFFGTPGYGRDFGETPDRLLNYVKSKKLDSLVDIKICPGNSIEIGKNLSGVSFNFISIDGDHTYEGCKGDFQSWSPLLKRKGLLAFNDIACLSVSRVISELEPQQWKFVRQIFNTKVFEKL